MSDQNYPPRPSDEQAPQAPQAPQIPEEHGQQPSAPEWSQPSVSFGQQSSEPAAPAPAPPSAPYGQDPAAQFGEQPSPSYGQVPAAPYSQAASQSFSQQPQYGQGAAGQYGQLPSATYPPYDQGQQYGQAATNAGPSTGWSKLTLWAVILGGVGVLLSIIPFISLAFDSLSLINGSLFGIAAIVLGFMSHNRAPHNRPWGILAAIAGAVAVLMPIVPGVIWATAWAEYGSSF